MNIHFDIYGLVTVKTKSLPYVSEGIPAGFPSPATDYIGDRIDLNEVLILNPGATYYARIRDSNRATASSSTRALPRIPGTSHSARYAASAC